MHKIIDNTNSPWNAQKGDVVTIKDKKDNLLTGLVTERELKHVTVDVQGSSHFTGLLRVHVAAIKSIDHQKRKLLYKVEGTAWNAQVGEMITFRHKDKVLKGQVISRGKYIAGIKCDDGCEFDIHVKNILSIDGQGPAVNLKKLGNKFSEKPQNKSKKEKKVANKSVYLS